MPVHDAVSGLVSSSMELLAFACHQFAPKIVYLCPLHSHYVLLLMSERSGRRKMPMERSALYNNAIIQQFRISAYLVAHVPGNHFYCSPCTHQLAHRADITSYNCRCVSGVATVETIALCFQFFGGNSRGDCGVLPWMFCVSPPRLSVIESGSLFFAIRSDLINVGLFIGNRLFWPLSNRNRFSSRYTTQSWTQLSNGHCPA